MRVRRERDLFVERWCIFGRRLDRYIGASRLSALVQCVIHC